MKTRLLLSVLLGALEGCASGQAVPKYSVVLLNGTTNAITDAHVRYGVFESAGGYLDPKIKKTDSIVPYPIPEKAIVVWKSDGGVQRKQEVEVAKILPKKFTGEIVFAIQNDGSVIVSHQPMFEMPKKWRVQSQ